MKEYCEQKIRENYSKLTKELIKRGLSITTMESATSGQIASLITDTEGASQIFRGAFITYSNEVKIMQGVPAEILEKYSVYSRETAEAMAKVCKEKLNADIGIGVTGTMGNVDPENAGFSVPGQVYFAIALKDDIQSFYLELPVQSSRLMYKLAVAEEVYNSLMKILT